MRQLTFILFLCTIFSTYSQVVDDSTRYFNQIEDFVLNDQLDSARLLLNEKRYTTEYSQILGLIADSKQPNYDQLLEFFAAVCSRQATNQQQVYQWYKRLVAEPNSFDYDYVSINYRVSMRARNEGDMTFANAQHDQLVAYIAQFDQSNRDVQRSTLLANEHLIVMAGISGDVENGMALALDNERIARALNDTNLITSALYGQAQLYAQLLDLDKYIDISQKAHTLDLLAAEHTKTYEGNLLNLIDGLIYRGGEDERVMNLLTELHSNNSPHLSLSLYAKFLGYASPESPYCQKIFDQFNVSDVVSLCTYFRESGESIMDAGNYFHLINECAMALSNFGEHKLAMQYKSFAIELTQKRYSQDLSKALADQQSALIRQEKELEIANEKSLGRLYILIAALAGVLLIIVLFAFIRSRKQRKLLQTQHDQIEVQRNELIQSDNEKSILLKEIHHRVKNNFQIVSSLLELQTRGIEDEKALALAQEGQHRIQSMAIIHQKLYQNDNLVIDLQDYIETLFKEIQTTNKDKPANLTLAIPQQLQLDIDTAIPLGLILNESITNSFKHAFTEGRSNELSIELSASDGAYKISISDNGPGLPESIDFKMVRSLGLRLIQRLSKQLQGGAQFESSTTGTTLHVSFSEIS